MEKNICKIDYNVEGDKNKDQCSFPSAIKKYGLLFVELISTMVLMICCRLKANSGSHVENRCRRIPYNSVAVISEDCLSTWRKLRDRYTRTKRVLPSGSEGGRKPWDKEQYMRFLDKMLVSRKTISNAGTQNIENNNITSPTVENATTEENTLSAIHFMYISNMNIYVLFNTMFS
ncbi:Alcohol dehydrogenase transcription factor Myb/SANT-like [Popillia japonica]|uniref:Alcohol dehydrogenase transcription factor Myb/SANT-like n=1 Tax=Popillia japonica TaxID=7064 RepID=A0AAW1KIX3_POPJA